MKKSWNSLLILSHKLSKGLSLLLLNMHFPELRIVTAQSQSILVGTFYHALSNDTSLSSSLKSTMWDLYRLFALFTMENEGYDCQYHEVLVELV